MPTKAITRTRIRSYVKYFTDRLKFSKAKAIKYVAREYGISQELVKMALR